MLGYTFVKGRGKVHAYRFSAATERLPYAAPWASALRASATISNQPVVEVQAARFGEPILIYSKYVDRSGRDYGYTQYLHPVPEPAEKIGTSDARMLAESIDRLLFYPNFLTEEAFQDLDDEPDPDITQKRLPAQRFALPALPEVPRVPCEPKLLAALAAELWKRCDARLREGKVPVPMCVFVCDAAHAGNTLATGLLFLAGTVIPCLPLSVRAILSVTVGATWTHVGNYEGTVCCIAQPEPNAILAGYDVAGGRYVNNLSPAEVELGEALVENRNLAYYRHMEELMDVSPMGADFTVALSLVTLCRLLARTEIDAASLFAVADLWQKLGNRLAERYRDTTDPTLRRQILLPAEKDLLRLGSAMAEELIMKKDVYRLFATHAFSLAGELPEVGHGLEELREGYARMLALPGAFEACAERPYEFFLTDDPLSALIAADPLLFERTLELYLKDAGTPVSLSAPVRAGISRALKRLPESMCLAIRKNLLKPFVIRCIRTHVSQRDVTEHCVAFGLTADDLNDTLVARFETDLFDGHCSDEDISKSVLFAGSQNGSEMRRQLLKILDKWFDQTQADGDWTRYLHLCKQLNHGEPNVLSLVFQYLGSRRGEWPMSVEETDELLEFCRWCNNPPAVEDHVWNYFDTLKINPADNESVSGQMGRFAGCYPNLLRKSAGNSRNWRFFQNEKIAVDLSKGFGTVSSWNELCGLSADWRERTGLGYLPKDDWYTMPERVDTEKLGLMVRDAYNRVRQREPLTIDNAKDRLAFTRRGDWLATCLQAPVTEDLWTGAQTMWEGVASDGEANRFADLLDTARVIAGARPCPTDVRQLRETLTVYQRFTRALEELLETRNDAAENVAVVSLVRQMTQQREADRLTALLRDRLCPLKPEDGANALLKQTETLVQRLRVLNFGLRLKAACLLSVRPEREGSVCWEQALPLVHPALNPRALKNLKPWSPKGAPRLRMLLYCLKACDQLLNGTAPRPETGATPYGSPATQLAGAYPRLTRAVRSRHRQRAAFRGMIDAQGQIDRKEALHHFGRSAVDWMLPERTEGD